MPLVSVILLSHNHAPYIQEAARSVINQTHTNTELIMVDDGSRDGTPDIIKELMQEFPAVRAVILEQNLGNCRAFNRGLSIARGSFIIDLSGDDILLPERIEKGLACFKRKGMDYGVNFTDAAYIDDRGKITGYHYRRDKNGELTRHIPQGRIYSDLLSRYFICTPTMMIRKEVYDQLGGYDENLDYEDFDFWIRSGKITKYCYTDSILVKKRILKTSLSARQYRMGSRLLHSTYLVCLKAEKLNSGIAERDALVKRVRYEFRKAILSGNWRMARLFAGLLIRNMDQGIMRSMILFVHFLLGSLTGTQGRAEEGNIDAIP